MTYQSSGYRNSLAVQVVLTYSGQIWVEVWNKAADKKIEEGAQSQAASKCDSIPDFLDHLELQAGDHPPKGRHFAWQAPLVQAASSAFSTPFHSEPQMFCLPTHPSPFQQSQSHFQGSGISADCLHHCIPLPTSLLIWQSSLLVRQSTQAQPQAPMLIMSILCPPILLALQQIVTGNSNAFDSSPQMSPQPVSGTPANLAQVTHLLEHIVYSRCIKHAS